MQDGAEGMQLSLDIPGLDETGHPYLRRQDAMEECFDTALHRDTNIHILGAATGSGKNYVAARWCAKIVCAGVDEDGCFKELPDRRYVCVCIPNTDNRSAFCRDLRAELVRRGMVSEVAERTVIDLEANSKGLERYMTVREKGKKGERRRVVDAPCPSSDAMAEWAAVQSRLREKVAVESLRGAGQAKREAARAFEESERALRKKIRISLRDGGDVDLETVARIWPAAKIDGDGPRVIVFTPQKFLFKVDTILNGTIGLSSEAFARQAVYIFDEFDRCKAEMLDSYIDNWLDFQPDAIVREMYERLIEDTSEMHGLITGDAGAWGREWGAAANKPGSAVKRCAVDGGYSQIAKDVRKGWERVEAAVRDTYGECNLRYRFKTDDDVSADRRLFGEDGLTVAAGSGGGRVPLTVSADAERRINLIHGRSEGGEMRLESVMARVQRTVSMVANHLDRVIRLRNSLLAGAVRHDEEASALSVLYGLGFNPDTDEVRLWKRIVDSTELKRVDNVSGHFLDESLYMRGAGFYQLEDDGERHPSYTFLKHFAIRSMPEARFTATALHAPVLAMSGTPNPPTVKAPNVEYLRDVQQVVATDGEWTALQSRIVGLTEELNGDMSRRYDVRVGFLGGAPAMEAFARARHAGRLVEAADLWPAAEAEMRCICDADAFVGAMKRVCTEESGLESLSGGGGGGTLAFRLGRLVRICRATAEWASACSRKEHYAALLLSQQSFSERSGDGGDTFASEVKGLMAVVISEASRAGGFWPRPVDADEAAEAIVAPDTASWGAEMERFKGRVEHGLPALMLCSFATAGYSKNVKYRIPDVLRTHEVDLGIDAALGRRTRDIDVDFLYIETPRNSLVSSVRDGDLVKGRLKAVVERTELSEGRFEIGRNRKRADIERVLAGGTAPTNSLPSAMAESARVVVQAVGRIQRTFHKLPNVRILMEDTVPGRCDFDFCRDLPCGIELKRAIAACEEFRAAIAPEGPQERERARADRIASFKNAHFMARHIKALNILFSIDGDDDPERAASALAAFDAERSEALARPCPMEPGGDKDRIRGMLRSERPCEGYAFAHDGEGSFRIEWPKEGESGLSCASSRIRERVRAEEGDSAGAWRFGRVSRAEARLAELLDVPCVAARFDEMGWDVVTRGDGTFHMTPYEFQNVYLGALGEEAGRAVIEEGLVGYRLTRGPAHLAERAGDFLVLDADGTDTGVWVDFKHYRIGAYEALSAELKADGRLDHVERFEEKAEAVGARCLIVVNVLADESAARLRAAGKGSGRVVTVPYLIRDGRVDERMLGDVRHVIDSFRRQP